MRIIQQKEIRVQLMVVNNSFMDNYKVLIANDSDRENSFIEVWFEDKLIAEITNENNSIRMNFIDVKNLNLDFNEFFSVIKSIQENSIEKI